MFNFSPITGNRDQRSCSSEQQRCFALLSWSLQPDSDPEAFFSLRDDIHQWDLFIELVRWHRVGALVWRRLSPFAEQLPAEVTTFLSRQAKSTAMQSLKLTHELKRVAKLLQENRIEFLVLKGLPLGQQLYGNTGLRFSKDIDILVREEDVERVHDMLVNAGFIRTLPGRDFPQAAISRYKEFCKDYIYRHQLSDVELELHWRLESNPHFLELNRFQPFQHTTLCNLAGIDLSVLSTTHQTLYLIMHAAHSCWGRLSWLTDIAELLRQPQDWNAVLALASTCGLTDAVWITANLAHRLLHTPLPKPLQPEHFSGGYSARLLLRYFLSSTPQPRYPSGITNRFLFFMLCQQTGFKRNHFSHGFAVTIMDIAALPLPRPLHFAYYPLRPAIYAWRQFSYRRNRRREAR